MAFKILRQAFGMITGNFREFLMIALFPMLLSFLFYTVAMYINPPTVNMHIGSTNTDMHSGTMGPGMLVGLVLHVIGGFFAVMVAVAWHRFVLLEQHPQGWLSAFKLDRVFPYIGYSILVSIVVILCVLILCILILVVPAVLVYLIAPHSMMQLAPLIGGAGAIVALTFAMIPGFRLSVMLPAAALHKSLTLNQAWVATKGSSFTLLLLFLLVVLIAVGLGGICAGLLLTPLHFVGLVGFALLAIVMSILQISILTTLYGHYVGGRELA